MAQILQATTSSTLYQSVYASAASSLSSSEAFLRSSAASAAASFSWSSSASAEALPLTAWFFCAGLRAVSVVPFAPSSSSASRRSISFCALAMFYMIVSITLICEGFRYMPPWSCGPGRPSRT
jgi:hypothetical protein